jgi:chromate reductase, NAD(P)H dehydrogenase (quinone)
VAAGQAGRQGTEETDMPAIRIAGIAGSLRRGSVNRMLLRAAGQVLPPSAKLETWDQLDRVPPFNEDWEADPAPLAVARLRELIAGADALLIATPEYNRSIPGQLKNALDWASRPRGSTVLWGKPAAVISTSPRAGGAAEAAADLRKVLAEAGASVIGAGLAVPRAFAQFTPDGQLTGPGLETRLRAVTAELIQAAQTGVTRHEQQAGGSRHEAA